jgi:hypothetical protein
MRHLVISKVIWQQGYSTWRGQEQMEWTLMGW